MIPQVNDDGLVNIKQLDLVCAMLAAPELVFECSSLLVFRHEGYKEHGSATFLLLAYTIVSNKAIAD
jgi:hypothetical protein